MRTAKERRERLDTIRSLGVRVPYFVPGALHQDVPPAEVRRWRWWSEIWERPTASAWTQNEALLPSIEREWDESSQFTTTQLERIAERKVQEAAVEEQRKAHEEARRKQEAETVKDQLRSQYLAIPGTTPEQFEAQYPTLLADHQRRQMEQRDREVSKAQQEMRRLVLAEM